MRKDFLCGVIFFGSLFFAGGEDNIIVLAYPDYASPNLNIEIVNRLLEDAFRDLGYEMEKVRYPEARCGYVADSGEADGVPRRIEGFDRAFTNLVKVDFPLMGVRFDAYAARPDLELEEWADLKSGGYSVAYVKGVQFIQEALLPLMPDNSLYPVHRTESGLEMLISGRVDVFIGPADMVDTIIGRTERYDGKVCKTGLYEERRQFLFLHRTHSDLAVELEETLRRLSREGGAFP